MRARPAHNLKVIGSNPIPATNFPERARLQKTQAGRCVSGVGTDKDSVQELSPIVPAVFAPLSRNLSRTEARRMAGSLCSAADALREVARIRDPPDDDAPVEVTTADAVNLFLQAKRVAGCRHRYLVQLRSSLQGMLRSIGSRPLAGVSASLLEAWLASGGWSARTRSGLLTDARGLFSWCVRRGWMEASPAAAVDRPRSEEKPAALHTPEQASAVLAAAWGADKDVCRLLAVCYFAGLRWGEASKLCEADIAGGWVRVPAAKSKTRSRRVVEVCPALEHWLAGGGKLPVVNLVRRWRAVRDLAAVPWPPNVTRHSWCSYHLAAYGNAGKTALEAGHAESVLFRHYRENVTREAAVAFFALRHP